MSLTSGSRLGPYEILSPIGAGGMGEVYEARDTRLDRRVAIKILPSHLAENPHLRERFEREARAISGLNHPHICTLHDIGNENGVDFLVMEYLEGEDLAERLKKGPLPLDLALRYGIEIADALDQVHRHGVVHRDLKPGNIMLTESGAKLTDFGLAKLAGAQGVSVASSLPTQQKPLTEEGAILGTFQYMSPEQLEGKEADSRTDIFAFGNVLYEMVTGKKAFEGKSQASLISAIMSSVPRPVSELQPMSPPLLDHVVKRCLEKDPGDRWQSARDVMMELKWVADGGSNAGVRAPEALPSRKWERIVGVAGLLLLTGGLVASVFTRAPTPERLVRKLSMTPPNAIYGPPVVSPDGLYVTLIAEDSSGIRKLWVRSLDSLAWRPLPGTERAVESASSSTFWSPDSRFIAFWSDGKLKRVALSGGSVQTICEVNRVPGGTWSRDGVILMETRGYQGLQVVPASGGDPKPATTPDGSRGDIDHNFPQFLPDGEHFLYYGRGTEGANGVYLGTLGSDHAELIVLHRTAGTSSPTLYTPQGYLLYVREGNLIAQPFDAARAELTGEAIAVASGVAARGFSVSDTGVLAYSSTTGPELSELAWFDRRGRRLQPVSEPGYYSDIELSPDGSFLAAERFDPDTENYDIWEIDLSRDVHSRLTSYSGWDFVPRWSPEGDRIAFVSTQAGYGFYQMFSNGRGELELLYDSKTVAFLCDWSRDGSHMAFSRDGDLLAISMSGDSETFPILDSEFDESRGRFSPDGRLMAYESNETGRPEIYVTTFPEADKKWQISSEGGEQPRWRDDGKELFFVSAEGELMAATVRGGSEFGVDVPEALPLAVPPGGTARYRYDVTPDGERFLVLNPVKGAGAKPITVVFNWFEELKRLVPTN